MRMLFRGAIALIFCASALVLSAGTGPTLAGAGYAAPSPIRVAPGQVVTFFVTGLSTVLPADSRTQRASNLPLPKNLAGISVRIQQATPGGFSGQIPMFAVQQMDQCSGQSAQASPDCFLTALTVEIPFELVLPSPTLPIPFSTDLTIEENGVAGKSFSLLPVANNPHVLTRCDLLVGSAALATCDPVITHADGSLVSTSNPAKGDEVLILYAVGLGNTSANPALGVPTPSPAPSVTTPFGVTFDYVDALTNIPLSGLPSSPQTSIIFAGLTPGLVGLYQVNFRLQSARPGFPSCSDIRAPNLTINLISPSGATDTARLCVDAATTSASPQSNATNSTAPGAAIPAGPFAPNTIWYPIGSDLSSLGQLVPPQSTALPPGQTIGVINPKP